MSSPLSLTEKPLDLEITVVSAKHIKNVNWRHGDLKPYAVAYIEPDHRAATKPDDAGSTRPVWNERFLLPLPFPLHVDSPLLLTLDIFHSKPSETPKPLVGTVRLPLEDLIEFEVTSSEPTLLRTLELRRPSGRPQGKIRIKLAIRERPCAPESNYATPLHPPAAYKYRAPPPSRDYQALSSPSSYNHPVLPLPLQYPYGNYSNPYSRCYSAAEGYHFSSPPALAVAAPLSRPTFYGKESVHGVGGVGPSAPVDCLAGASFEQKLMGRKMGMGERLAVDAGAGGVGGLVLGERLKHRGEKIAGKIVGNLAGREDYSDYRRNY